MQEKQTRKVRLCRKFRWLTDTREVQEVPWLNVSGLWLERAGFRMGDQVEITINNQQLIIKNCGINGNH
jgi:toxic protein SymE